MSHGKLRDDKTCLNCGHQVEERFCPHCGQENIESRQPFHFLFTHFIEDFTHYDGQFWKTIQYLFTRPGKLTKEYLAGKRQLYVAPVKLYIFISFITFFLPNLIPHAKEEAEKSSPIKTEVKAEKQKKISKNVVKDLQKEGLLSHETAAAAQKTLDTLKIKDEQEKDELFDSTFDTKEASIMKAYTMKQYDSIRAKDNTGIYTLMRPIANKVFDLKEEGYSKHQIWEKYKENFIHTIPKALFVYLPIFAFFLWLFHNKRKWWYFDHGIFTLHYFSFLLLGVLMFMVGEKITSFLPDNSILTLLYVLACLALATYMTIYFFVAHHRVYETKKRISILKGSLLFIVNYIGLLLMFLVLMYLSFIMLH
ncbi:DUF3667 domain-containing protein [Chryseobacterium gleum]|uniref:DUF3667 domain-containing protein n=1 Tax=Chryseobacterium gleum TaxID=250 RepID=UPI001E5E7E0E|nr:DUF3667 domain-containing protein [Chryseobacterium gleum]MCE4065587.1 DUF3667 domain-containing protein [Chryseobacterium gleum]